MLKVNAVSKSFGSQQTLAEVSFNLNRGERLALVGPNGCGKSTLLKILSGSERPDSGGFQLSPPSMRLSYLPQGLVVDSSSTISDYLDRTAGDLGVLEDKLEALSARLARESDLPELQREFDQTLSAIQSVSQNENQRQVIMDGLRLDHLGPDTLLAHLSGGQKTRLALAGLLLSSPDLLLLDEPTNHLDIEMLEWLEAWLVNSPLTHRSGIILVSHDRIFLDNVATGILEIDPGTHRMYRFEGNYSAYREAKLSEAEKHHQVYTDQQEEIARLRRSAQAVRGKAAFRKGGKGDSGDKLAKGFFANRTKEHVARARHIEDRLEKLLGEDHVDKPAQTWQMKLEFNSTSKSSRQVLVLEDLCVGYNGKPLLEGLSLTVRHGQRIALVGPNGSGKTTLMRTIAGTLPPVCGKVRLGRQIVLGYSTQEQEMLDPNLDALQTILRMASMSETEARSFLHKYLFSGDDVFVRISDLSFGERARLMLACLVAGGSNLLLLDEPINHLDIPSRGRFEQALAGFDGTVIAVVHDRFFITNFATRIWEISLGSLRDYPLR